MLRCIAEYFNAVFLYGAFTVYVFVVIYRIQHKSQQDISPLCGMTMFFPVSGSTGKSTPLIMSRLSVLDFYLHVIIYR